MILPFDQTAARHFGRLRAELRRAGRPIPAIDLQISAVALDRGLTILTTDSHFGHIPGLVVDSWLKP